MPLIVMTAAGWIFMIVGWSIIIGITFFCFLKVLRLNRLKDPED